MITTPVILPVSLQIYPKFSSRIPPLLKPFDNFFPFKHDFKTKMESTTLC